MKKPLFIFSNLCFIYMLVLLCLLNPYDIKEDAPDNVNLQAKVSEKNIYTPTPYKAINPTSLPQVINVPTDWYISEYRGSFEDELKNIMILGFEDKFNKTNLIIYADVNMNSVRYNSNLFKWSSSNPQIASVVNGLVIAFSAGTVEISAERNGQIKKYDFKVFSPNSVDLIIEVNDTPVTNEISIDSQIYFSGYLFIKEINLKIEIPNFTRLSKWTSSDINKINLYDEYPNDDVAIPFMTGKATLTSEIFGITTKIDLNIIKPNLSRIKSSENNTTYYMKVYNKTLQTSIEIPFKLTITDSKGKIVNVAQFINWKSSDTNVSEDSIDSSGFKLNYITAKIPGKVIYTGEYFGQKFNFKVDVTNGVVTKPDLIPASEQSIYVPPIQEPIYLFEKDNPTPMSEINKKIVYSLKDNINDAELISDANKDSIKINTIKTGYFTQLKDREVIAIIHLELNDGIGTIYKEIVGIFDSETFKYKTHKVFTAKGPNSIYVDSTSILFIPIDSEHDYMANTVEIWTAADEYWKINSKPKDSQYHKYGFRKDIIMVFDKVDKIDCEWEFKYSLRWYANKLTFVYESYDTDVTRGELEQAIIPDVTQNENNNYVDNGINVTGLHVLCNNLIFKMDKFKDFSEFTERIYYPLRDSDSYKSQVCAGVPIKSIEYGYFTQTGKLEILAIFEFLFNVMDGPHKYILMVCDAETYEVKAQTIFSPYGNTTFNIYKDSTGRTSILCNSDGGWQGSTSSNTVLLEVSDNLFKLVWEPIKDNIFSKENAFALTGNKLIILNKFQFKGKSEVTFPLGYESEYHWDAVQRCFIES